VLLEGPCGIVLYPHAPIKKLYKLGGGGRKLPSKGKEEGDRKERKGKMSDRTQTKYCGKERERRTSNCTEASTCIPASSHSQEPPPGGEVLQGKKE